jgi:hypothetical protein
MDLPRRHLLILKSSLYNAWPIAIGLDLRRTLTMSTLDLPAYRVIIPVELRWTIRVIIRWLMKAKFYVVIISSQAQVSIANTSSSQFRYYTIIPNQLLRHKC